MDEASNVNSHSGPPSTVSAAATVTSTRMEIDDESSRSISASFPFSHSALPFITTSNNNKMMILPDLALALTTEYMSINEVLGLNGSNKAFRLGEITSLKLHAPFHEEEEEASSTVITTASAAAPTAAISSVAATAAATADAAASTPTAEDDNYDAFPYGRSQEGEREAAIRAALAKKRTPRVQQSLKWWGREKRDMSVIERVLKRHRAKLGEVTLLDNRSAVALSYAMGEGHCQNLRILRFTPPAAGVGAGPTASRDSPNYLKDNLNSAFRRKLVPNLEVLDLTGVYGSDYNDHKISSLLHSLFIEGGPPQLHQLLLPYDVIGTFTQRVILQALVARRRIEGCREFSKLTGVKWSQGEVTYHILQHCLATMEDLGTNNGRAWSARDLYILGSFLNRRGAPSLRKLEIWTQIAPPFHSAQIEPVFRALENGREKLPRLQYLTLRSVPLGHPELRALVLDRLCTAIREGALPLLEELVLESCGMNDAVVDVLIDAMRMRESTYCSSSSSAAAAAADRKGPPLPYLKTLDVSWNADVQGNSMISLAQAMKSSLTVGEGGRLLRGRGGGTSPFLPSLERLRLTGCKIGDDGVLVLLYGLVHANIGREVHQGIGIRLKTLDLANCDIGVKGMRALAGAFYPASSFNDDEEEQQQQGDAAPSSGGSHHEQQQKGEEKQDRFRGCFYDLERLNVGYNKEVGDQGMMALIDSFSAAASAVGSSPLARPYLRLKELHLGAIGMTHRGAEHLGKAFGGGEGGCSGNILPYLRLLVLDPRLPKASREVIAEGLRQSGRLGQWKVKLEFW